MTSDQHIHETVVVAATRRKVLFNSQLRVSFPAAYCMCRLVAITCTHSLFWDI